MSPTCRVSAFLRLFADTTWPTYPTKLINPPYPCPSIIKSHYLLKMRKRILYSCKYYLDSFHPLGDYRWHMHVHKQQLPDSRPVKPPNQLLSRQSTTEGDGVFDFDEVLYPEDWEHIFSVASDADSYYSDEAQTRANQRMIPTLRAMTMTNTNATWWLRLLWLNIYHRRVHGHQ